MWDCNCVSYLMETQLQNCLFFDNSRISARLSWKRSWNGPPDTRGTHRENLKDAQIWSYQSNQSSLYLHATKWHQSVPPVTDSPDSLLITMVVLLAYSCYRIVKSHSVIHHQLLGPLPCRLAPSESFRRKLLRAQRRLTPLTGVWTWVVLRGTPILVEVKQTHFLADLLCYRRTAVVVCFDPSPLRLKRYVSITLISLLGLMAGFFLLNVFTDLKEGFPPSALRRDLRGGSWRG